MPELSAVYCFSVTSGTDCEYLQLCGVNVVFVMVLELCFWEIVVLVLDCIDFIACKKTYLDRYS